jgi:hypothetical protein
VNNPYGPEYHPIDHDLPTFRLTAVVPARTRIQGSEPWPLIDPKSMIGGSRLWRANTCSGTGCGTADTASSSTRSSLVHTHVVTCMDVTWAVAPRRVACILDGGPSVEAGVRHPASAGALASPHRRVPAWVVACDEAGNRGGRPALTTPENGRFW